MSRSVPPRRTNSSGKDPNIQSGNANHLPFAGFSEAATCHLSSAYQMRTHWTSITASGTALSGTTIVVADINSYQAVNNPGIDGQINRFNPTAVTTIATSVTFTPGGGSVRDFWPMAEFDSTRTFTGPGEELFCQCASRVASGRVTPLLS